MLSARVDNILTRLSAKENGLKKGVLSMRCIDTPVGTVRVYDSGSKKPCVIFVPDGPNVIEHYEGLISLLAQKVRVICFDMPGFGYSLPQATYEHSLDQGAKAVLGVLDGLGIEKATLAFSCANGFYALRAAQLAPDRIVNLVLSQTPSLTAMHTWSKRAIPWPLGVPVVGQIVGWLFRQKLAHVWYGISLPRTTTAEPFTGKAHDALASGGCFCLASVAQGLTRANMDTLSELSTPCTVIWGAKDHSHKYTNPNSLLESIPHADLVHFEDCGHFPDLEQPERFAELLLAKMEQYG